MEISRRRIADKSKDANPHRPCVTEVETSVLNPSGNVRKGELEHREKLTPVVSQNMAAQAFSIKRSNQSKHESTSIADQGLPSIKTSQ
jgi:hypothetical protein